MDKQRIENFAGVNILQSQQYNDNYDSDDLVQSKFDQTNNNIGGFSIQNEAENYEDLGIEFYTAIQQEYTEKNKVKIHDSNVLFDFYKTLRKQQLIKFKNEYARLRTKKEKEEYDQKQKIIQELLDKDDKDLTEKEKVYLNKEKRARILRSMVDYKEDSVKYTLKIHSEQQQKENFQEMKITKYFEKDYDKFRKSKELEKSKKVNIINTLNRLYNNKKDQKEQKVLNYNPQDYPKYDQKYRVLLTNGIIDDYIKSQLDKDTELYEINGGEKKPYEYFRNPQYLKEYSRKMTGKKEHVDKCLKESFVVEESNKDLQEKKKSKHQQEVIEKDIQLYFKDVIFGYIRYYEQQYGYIPQKNQNPIEQLMKYWEKMEDRNKSNLYVNFEGKKNFENLLTEYYEILLKEIKTEEEEKEKIQQEIEVKKKKYLNKKVFGKEEFKPQKTKLEELKKPKDKFKSGQTMLELHSKFSKDRILNEMIIQEFKENRLSKFPLEYDVFDSDEEDKVKQRKTKEQRITPENVYEIFEQRRAEKVDDLSEIFKEKLETYQNEKSCQIRELLQKQKTISRENKQMLRYLNQAAKKFIEMRKSRKKTRELQQKGLNVFVSSTFYELKKLYKNAMERNYPLFKYEETKKKKPSLSWLPFPPQFKRDFFDIVRVYCRTNLGKGKKIRLPFWAPPSINLQQRTLNEKIYKLSHEFMEINWEKDKPNTNVWDNQLYVEERQKILMKFEEAQNCTFNPCVGYRMSKRRKAVFDQVRKELSSNIAFLEKPGGFDEAVKKMGDNFQSKFPWLFKKGIIKKCWFLIQNEQFADAYSALCDRFHIKCIIQHFNPNVTKFLQDDPTSMFSFEKMGKKELQEEKLPKENFDNPKNKELLQEVFQQLMYMEAYERDIIKKIHLFEQRLPEDKKNIITQYKIKMKKASQQEINNQENQQKDQKEEKRQQLENMLKQSQDQQQSSSLAQKDQEIVKKEKEIQLLLIKKENNLLNEREKKELEEKQKSLHKKNQQELESQSKFSTSKFSNITVSTYASRRELVKSIMCPLGNKCPGIVGPRWHISNVKTCVPIGANCPFAHTIQELKFQKEIESKKQILFKFLMTVAQKGMQQPKQKAWNPAGNKFQLCLGCSQKTACSECKFRTKNKDIILQLSKFTKISNQKIFQRKSFKEKQINKQIACDSLNFKLGCLQKAAIFYKLQRYNEAFDVISKAIDVVQNEVEKEIHDSEKLQEKWKKQLQLESYGNEITADTILLAQTQKSEEKTEVQKLHLYGIKTGLIGQKKHSANEFINYQIEEMYKKIELKLNHGDSNVNLMKKKIGELEELQEMVEQRDANQDFGDEIQPVDINIDIENMDKEEVEDKLREKRLKIALNKAKTKMCPTLKTSGRCPRGKNCRYAHSANELLLVRPEKLIKNLKNAIVECEKIKLFKFWNPSGNQFEPCYGCGLCNFCKMEETNKEIFNLFRLASKKTNEKIRKKENYLSKVKQKKKRHVISDKKKHLLNKTNILLIQGQHNKAFEIILNAVKLVDVNYKKDDQLNYQIEQTYLSIKKYLETKYKDLVYLHFNIDEQQKLLEQAEIVDKIDRIDIAEKTEKQNEVKKTKSSYIQQKESMTEEAYYLFKQSNIEEANKVINKVSEIKENEPDQEEDPFNITLRKCLKQLIGKKKKDLDQDEEDYEDYQDDEKKNNENNNKQMHQLFRFKNTKIELYDQAIGILSREETDPLIIDQNKKDAIYLLKLALNYVKIEKQDLKYNLSVNIKINQTKELISKALGEKNKNYKEKKGLLDAAEKCIEAANYQDGFQIIINAIAIIRKETYNDQQNLQINKKINTVYSFLKQKLFEKTLREKPILTPVSQPVKIKQENETRISAFRGLKHQRDKTLEEKNQTSAIEEKTFKDPKTIGMVYPVNAIYQLQNAMFNIDQTIQQGDKNYSFCPTSKEESNKLFSEKERINKLDQKQYWDKNNIYNGLDQKQLEYHPFNRKQNII